MSISTGKIRILITGITGMVGEGVLHECLHHPDVEQVTAIVRRNSGIVHEKMTEIVHRDFFNIAPIEQYLQNFDACFFCLGVSSVGMKEADYTRLTYTLTLNIAKALSSLKRDMTFCYISGAGTDSTERGRMMWARVKGKTENDLMKLPFKAVYNFRPAMLEPTGGLKNTLAYYKTFSWLIPMVKFLMPGRISSLRSLGLAMIHVAIKGYPKSVLEVKDIKILGD